MGHPPAQPVLVGDASQVAEVKLRELSREGQYRADAFAILMPAECGVAVGGQDDSGVPADSVEQLTVHYVVQIFADVPTDLVEHSRGEER